jgi:hypothetical protein
MTLAFTEPAAQDAVVMTAVTKHDGDACAGDGTEVAGDQKYQFLGGLNIVGFTKTEVHTLKDGHGYANDAALKEAIAADGWSASDKWDVWTYTTPTSATGICAKTGADAAAKSVKFTTTLWAAASSNSTGDANSTADANTTEGNASDDNSTSGAKTMGAAFAAAALAVAATQF